jgi:hypothetical protein
MADALTKFHSNLPGKGALVCSFTKLQQPIELLVTDYHPLTQSHSEDLTLHIDILPTLDQFLTRGLRQKKQKRL